MSDRMKKNEEREMTAAEKLFYRVAWTVLLSMVTAVLTVLAIAK